VEDKWVCEGSGRACALREETARRYLRDIVCGLMYLHVHVIFLYQSLHDTFVHKHNFCISMEICMLYILPDKIQKINF
jgi:hypothetical protein